MTFDATALLRAYDDMDRALVAAGYPATSPWWRAEIERFVRSGCRRWVIRAGRRAGKSTTLCRLAVCWALFGAWHVPPGDTAVIPFVSVSRDESAGRLRTIAALLRTLGVSFDQRGDEIELGGTRRVVFRTIACTTTAVVGFTSIAVVGDEIARWESRETAANPAAEVIGSLMPTLATQEHGFAALCSSPWSQDDYHAQLFALGDDGHQIVSFAETWIANPSITEERTHELEPDGPTWSREYAALPGATVSPAVDRDDALACFGRVARGQRRQGFVAIDPSSLVSGDEYAYIAGYTTDAREIVVCETDGWDGSDVDFDDVIGTIVARARKYRAQFVHSDHYEQGSAAALYRQHNVTVMVHPWSGPSKHEAMQFLRTLMRDRLLILPEHATLRSELLGMRARLAPSGQTHYPTTGLDYASALITLMHAFVAGNLRLEGSAGAFRDRTAFREARRVFRSQWDGGGDAIDEPTGLPKMHLLPPRDRRTGTGGDNF